MMTDLEIASARAPKPIEQIAAKLGLTRDALEYYGPYKAKVNPKRADMSGADGKLVLVTAINPTPAGEGKTTVSVGLADALSRIGKKTVLALREPSLGPVFGMKGGAAGGGYAQVVPMQDINLHFTGDLHAITAANNLLAAMIDNHIYQGNALGIDPRAVSWRRCMDMNDRQLRSIVDGLGGKSNGTPREDGFDITTASEIMAVLCLCSGISDLKERLGNIRVGLSYDGTPIHARDLKAQGAMAALLRDAVKPNLVQTLEGTPAFVHGGPFANIAHGCNSVIATKTALKLGDYVVTEAGFGADLGAEKFLDIKCRASGLFPSCAVLVATARALKSHGGADKESLKNEDLAALAAGLPNLAHHIRTLRGVYGLPVVVAVNRFDSDSDAELALIEATCRECGAEAALCRVWEQGGAGGEALARLVTRLCEQGEATPRFCYDLGAPLSKKIRLLAQRVYGASAVQFAPGVLTKLKRFDAQGDWPVCMAKTQYSLSDDPKKLGEPTDFTLTVRDVRLCEGAGFVVAFCGDIIAMPGLPKIPAAQNIDVDDEGNITGLF